jgi:hypothetical protein
MFILNPPNLISPAIIIYLTMAPHDPAEISLKKPPVVTSLQDLAIIEAWDSEANQPKYVTFYLVTPDEEVYFGQSTKNKRDLTLAEYGSALQHVKDEEIYPGVPNDITLTIAPDELDDTSAFIKRPGLNCYETMKGTDYIPKVLLEEALITEQISKTRTSQYRQVLRLSRETRPHHSDSPGTPRPDVDSIRRHARV